MSDVLESAARWIGQGKGVALATVVKTWGSAPRPVGSQLAVSSDGAFEGSVSSGCVEGAVIEEALDCIRTGRSRKLAYGVSDETAWSFGLPCGGQIEVFIEPVTA